VEVRPVRWRLMIFEQIDDCQMFMMKDFFIEDLNVREKGIMEGISSVAPLLLDEWTGA
jgi:hypothetical protein